METRDQDHRTLGSLLREFMEEGRNLFKQEVALAKTEAAEKASLMGRNAAYLAAGGAVAFAGALCILAGLSLLVTWGLTAAGVSTQIALWLGPLIVGFVVTLVGGILVTKALKTFKDGSLKPELTIRSVQEDKNWAKEQLQRA